MSNERLPYATWLIEHDISIAPVYSLLPKALSVPKDAAGLRWLNGPIGALFPLAATALDAIGIIANKGFPRMRTSSAARKQRSEASEVAEIQSLRSQLKRLTKERLISSAIELFTLNGFRATSVGDIAKAAGTTPTTFYRYFSSKSDIARLLQDHINIDVKKTFERLDEVKRPTKQAIRGWVDQYDQMWQRTHVLCDAFWEATRIDGQLAAELVPVTFKLTESMKAVNAIANEESKTRFQLRLVLMYLLMDRLLYLVDIQGRNPSALKMLEEFSEIFRGALFPDGK